MIDFVKTRDDGPDSPSTAACCAPIGLDPDCGEAVVLFRALSDPTRLAILRALRARGEVCACEFLDCCAVGQPTLSHHLKVLREAGLVTAEKRGLWMYYRANDDRLEAIRALVP